MTKTILLTGTTDGIGFHAAQKLAASGHTLLLHGRSEEKLENVKATIQSTSPNAAVETYRADLSRFDEVEDLAEAIATRHQKLDVLINNAGVFRTAHPRTPDGLDARMMVNTIAPYLLTRRLLPLMGPGGRIINLSSAAQAPVDLDALAGDGQLSDNAAYAQSKLAITAWSRVLADELGDACPAVIAVNPGSLLATKMVREAYGMSGADINIGADILVRAALDDAFASASGEYFDNDTGRFAPPHPAALDDATARGIVRSIHAVVQRAGLTMP
ncbi:MAG: SDR family NAD(P)-dependent oxidoreductase [Planctomycetota bacterium]